MQKLNNNTLALQALLTKVNNLPEGGSSGGGGADVETTNVTVTGRFVRIVATVYTDGSISSIILTGADDGDISNVVRGSAVFIVHDYSEDMSVTGATKVDKFVISEMEMVAGSVFQID